MNLQVAEEYKLRPETLFIAVNYIDRFLAKSPVQRGKLQLVGITAMLIAAYATLARRGPRPIRRISSARRFTLLSLFPRFTGSTRRSTLQSSMILFTSRTIPTRARRCGFHLLVCTTLRAIPAHSNRSQLIQLGSRRQVLCMESVVLNTLNFELSTISILKFLARFLKAARLDQIVTGAADQQKKISEMKLFAEVRKPCGQRERRARVTPGPLQYVAELTLQDYKFIKILPSKIAAAVVSLTLRVFRQTDWVRHLLMLSLLRMSSHRQRLQTPTLQHYTKYEFQDLRPCLILLSQTVQVAKGPRHDGVPSFMIMILSSLLQGSTPTAGQQPLQAVRDKYRSSKFGRVSAYPLDALVAMPYV